MQEKADGRGWQLHKKALPGVIEKEMCPHSTVRWDCPPAACSSVPGFLWSLPRKEGYACCPVQNSGWAMAQSWTPTPSRRESQKILYYTRLGNNPVLCVWTLTYLQGTLKSGLLWELKHYHPSWQPLYHFNQVAEKFLLHRIISPFFIEGSSVHLGTH